MNIYINGERRIHDGEALSLDQLLSAEGYAVSDDGEVKAARMVAALNGSVISKTSYVSTTLSEGDRVDVVGVITGG